MTSIFSTYSTGENRVTASFLAVLRSLSLDRIQRLLGALLEQSEFELVQFENQPSKGSAGVPDAIIQSSIRLLIETKTERNGVDLPQIKRHIVRLDQAGETTALLLVLTPDDVRPAILDVVKGGSGCRLLQKAHQISTVGTDRSRKPLKILSPAMQKVFGDFDGKVSIQRSPPRWVESEFVEKAVQYVEKLK